MKPKLLHIVLLLLFVFSAVAHSLSAKQRAITAPRWEELKKQKDFSYQNTVEFNKPPKASSNGLAKAIQAIFEFFASPVGKSIIWVLLLGFVAWLVYKTVISNKGLFGKKKLKSNEAADIDDPENLLETNWELQFQKASESRDIRLAIRYSYMWLLQMMQQNEVIRYKPDKTNYDYYYELNDADMKQLFRSLSRQYEYAWYGNYSLPASSYEEYMGRFQSLKTRLNR